ncbi:MAG: recombinase family protein [Dehalococcoidia bacterium]|nr:MAG: recombinase family protein [Dehalococcoidia bacterium]
MMKAVIYSRVSTDNQDNQNQVETLTRWAKDRGFNIVEVYQETDTAWKAGHQGELKRLLDGAYKAKFQYVLVWALDRLSREGAYRILSLVHRLKQFGVQLISFQEPWTEAPGELGELLFALTGWVAKMESQRRSERTKAGILRARKNGKPIGKRGRDKKKRRRSVKNVLY